MTRPLRLHWSRSKRNFGDALSPLLCGHLSGRPIEHAAVNRCELLALGSLLQRAGEGWFRPRVHVWGSGFIEPCAPHRTRHRIHAVRGRLTRALLINAPDAVLGDPGLLADRLLPPEARPRKSRPVGIVCHYKDRDDPLVAALARKHTEAVILDVTLEPREFLRRLCGCEVIFSSAMHPLIAADALGIPNAWIRLSDQVRGGDFKFQDYYSAFGIADARPERLDEALMTSGLERIRRNYNRPGLARIQQELVDSFPFPAA